ncbi:hypothetical protein C4Q31_18855 [Leptospira borgpetersenii serovar Ceylonica]|nr:hypothetical protein C4Q31_18855 [Leptospira borgpetersenii serovar Ceylonica]
MKYNALYYSQPYNDLDLFRETDTHPHFERKAKVALPSTDHKARAKSGKTPVVFLSENHTFCK